MATLHLHTGDLSKFAAASSAASSMNMNEADYAAVTPTAARPHPERGAQYNNSTSLFDSYGPSQYLYQQARLQHNQPARPPCFATIADNPSDGDGNGVGIEGDQGPLLGGVYNIDSHIQHHHQTPQLRIEAKYIQSYNQDLIQQRLDTTTMSLGTHGNRMRSSTTSSSTSTPISGGSLQSNSSSIGEHTSSDLASIFSSSASSTTSATSESALNSGGPHTPPSSRASPDSTTTSFMTSIPGTTIYNAHQNHHIVGSNGGVRHEGLAIGFQQHQHQNTPYLQHPQPHHVYQQQQDLQTQPFQYAGYSSEPLAVGLTDQAYDSSTIHITHHNNCASGDYGSYGSYPAFMTNNASFDTVNINSAGIQGQAHFLPYGNPTHHQYTMYAGPTGTSPMGNQGLVQGGHNEHQTNLSPEIPFNSVPVTQSQHQQRKIISQQTLSNPDTANGVTLAAIKLTPQSSYTSTQRNMSESDTLRAQTGHPAASPPTGGGRIQHQQTDSLDSVKSSFGASLSGSDDSGGTTRSTISHYSAVSGGSKSSHKRGADHLGTVDKPYDTATPTNKEGGGKKFICSYPGCEKSFSRNFNLSTHFNTHLGVKPFPCTHCSKSFSRRHDCARHIAAVHSHETGKKHRKKDKINSIDMSNTSEDNDQEVSTFVQLSPNSCGCNHTCAAHRPSVMAPVAIASRGPSVFAFIKGFEQDQFSSSGYESTTSSSGNPSSHSQASSAEPENGGLFGQQQQQQMTRSPSFASSTVSLDIGAVKIEDQDGD